MELLFPAPRRSGLATLHVFSFRLSAPVSFSLLCAYPSGCATLAALLPVWGTVVFMAPHNPCCEDEFAALETDLNGLLVSVPSVNSVGVVIAVRSFLKKAAPCDVFRHRTLRALRAAADPLPRYSGPGAVHVLLVLTDPSR